MHHPKDDRRHKQYLGPTSFKFRTKMMESPLRKLEQVGALQLLAELANLETESYVTKLIRRGNKKDGIASDRALLKARENLKELGLLVENVQETLPFRTVMHLTKKGHLVAEKILEILDVIK